MGDSGAAAVAAAVGATWLTCHHPLHCPLLRAAFTSSSAV